MANPAEQFAFTVGHGDHGKRLDLFLAEHLPAQSRSQIQRYIREGFILLNTAKAKGGIRIRERDLIEGQVPTPQASVVIPQELPLTFIYEDEHIVVVDKPSGMAVHPAGRVTTGTLVNALLYHVHDLQGVGGVLRPGIVHRLDKGTSGVMVVAKNDRAHDALVQQFKGREVHKIYLALAFGTIKGEEGVITAPMGRHPIDRKRFSLRTRQPKDALTEWQVKERFDGITFVQLSPKTGRTHQIRVHMSAIGHPLVGDPLYTKKRWLNRIEDLHLQERIKALGRQALHAFLLAFRHPTTGERMEFTAPMPDDMKQILEVLRGKRV
jgi:23S rRNA pseudouridine1911/1915/1917 synthase